jgi:hypothetical protein
VGSGIAICALSSVWSGWLRYHGSIPRDFHISKSVRTGFGAHAACYYICIGRDPFRFGDKASEAWSCNWLSHQFWRFECLRDPETGCWVDLECRMVCLPGLSQVRFKKRMGFEKQRELGKLRIPQWWCLEVPFFALCILDLTSVVFNVSVPTAQ